MLVAFVILALLVGSVLLLWRSQERILFQPPRLREAPPESGRVSYDTVDGQRLTGFMVGDPKSAPGTLLCFHGNADLAVWQLDWARMVNRHTRYAVFLAEYRGYMSLGGNPTYSSTKLDARGADLFGPADEHDRCRNCRRPCDGAGPPPLSNMSLNPG